jgi:uncharacterized protein YecE (DUF72 family)
MKRGGELRVGISGWRYPGWRGKFYPKDLPNRRELEYASRILNSVEINGSFYSLQLPSSYQRWHSETPDDFVFAVKGARFITQHEKVAGCQNAACQLLCLGCAGSSQKTRADSLATPAEPQLEQRTVGRIFRIVAARHSQRSKAGQKAQ